MRNEFDLVEVNSQEWLERIAYFRIEVWKLNAMVDMAYYPENKCLEEVDKIATHRVVELKGRLIAATRYTQYPNMNSSHNGAYYRQEGIELPGPIGIPEHTVVHPEFVGRGLGKAITIAHRQQALQNGVRFIISENTKVNADLLRKMGKKSLGMAPPDPRFPGIQFEWICSDLEPFYKNLDPED
ncbi:MAG: hypothetical protein COB20_12865 [SAR86 cluster bacterium]|uniref:N-acetyltransferase domain-containing protein n=1 Tax=SAR86 cluster bacterium TaxID=2030880 RepID=A0A2A4WYQ5_9GAMM|nr:MAG: hypothetical protein COB20_12865 [SAR86 cluster bacterium]